jgi:hypothetical protein
MLGSACALIGSTLDMLTPHTVVLAISQSGQVRVWGIWTRAVRTYYIKRPFPQPHA